VAVGVEEVDRGAGAAGARLLARTLHVAHVVEGIPEGQPRLPDPGEGSLELLR
jgi:hypothetical protein